MGTWTKVKEKLSPQIAQIEKEMAFELGGRSLAAFFEEVSTYADMLTQSAITRYNALIGGKSEGDRKVQGLNEYINLYNQMVGCKNRLPKMTELYKMILSDRESVSWLPNNFKTDNELTEAVEKAYKEIVGTVFIGKDNQPSLKKMLANLKNYDLSGIFIKNDTILTAVVKQAYGDWAGMSKGLAAKYNDAYPQGKKSDEIYAKERKEWMDSFDSFSIKDICYYTQKNDVVNWYEGLWSKDDTNAFEKVENAYQSAKDLLNTEYRGNLKEDAKSIETLKRLLDALKELQRLAETLRGCGDESGRDGRFYAEWESNMVVLEQVTPLYNMVRNYVTQKPYSEEKFKLNFNSPQLMNGWDQNKEVDCLGVLLRKEGMYYLGIMDKSCRRSFSGDLPCDGDCYEKVDYKLLPGANKMLPKVFFSNKNIDFYGPSAELMSHYEQGTHKKGEQFNIKHCRELIDFFKSSIERHPDWVKFDFEFSNTNNYNDISDFYREVEQQGYNLTFHPVSMSYIDTLVDDGKLYLFQIYNKDFSTYSKGTPNMHTLYWKALFSEDNLKDVVYKLNGEAEVFFRRKSVTYDEKHQREGYHRDKLEGKFDYPIYKDRRYSIDKFQFHVPITMNFKATGRENIDQQVREFAKAGGVKHIIGIDRGERHLLYLSMIDLKGRIVKQFSLNDIVNEYKGQTYRTNYRKLLDKKEENRDTARRNWQTIERIKDLKEGYLSQVVHIISQMMVEYQAIVVLEDLNFGFMRGRQKVEKQIYQKFEKMLIDKLNYLVNKKNPIDEIGGVLHALQLTSKFECFQKLGKQSGFLFYVPASLTSKIDPVTGFANYINTKYESREKACELLDKFADIRYNEAKGYFEFVIDEYKKFNPKAAGRQQWRVCSYGTRIKTFRNLKKNSVWDSEEIHLTKELKQLFDDKGIDYSSNLKEQILCNDDAKFLEQLLYLLGLVLQMRNSESGTEVDYIISPVANDEGEFYCSNNANDALPKDADANGAYNIARKGLWAVMRMRQATDPMEVKLTMSNEEWMNFAQEKPYKK
ncbi:MAG: type V CRISPR-associated protein Cas12a/Cpf1, partial [Bacteroidales bacterium]|nr:type V CRISPR-associated protein Cas12a/Cpf1 [Bacteroidales bacterium]